MIVDNNAGYTWLGLNKQVLSAGVEKMVFKVLVFYGFLNQKPRKVGFFWFFYCFF